MKTQWLSTLFFAIVAAAVASARPHGAADVSVAAALWERQAAPANNGGGANASNSTNSTAGGGAAVLLQGLKALHFNTLATILQNYTDVLAGFITQNITFLAPTDEAFAKAGSALAHMPKDQVLALLEYHALKGNYSTDMDSKYFNESKHTIAQTLLANKTYVDFGPKNNKSQVMVLSRDAKGFPVVIEAGRNVTFASKNMSFAQGNLRLAGISQVLNLPGNLSDVIKDLGLKGLPQVTKTLNLSDALDMAGGLTVFAPTDQAFAAAQKALTSAGNMTIVTNVLRGHVINGTVIYGPDLTKTLEMAQKNASSSKSTEGIPLANITASAGQTIEVMGFANGSIMLMSGNSSAMVVSTDKLFKGGVVHTIDSVLFNPVTNETAAAIAYEHYSTAAANSSSKSAGGVAGATDSGDNGGIYGATSGNDTNSTAGAGGKSAAAKADVDIGVVSLIVAALAIAGGVAVLL